MAQSRPPTTKVSDFGGEDAPSVVLDAVAVDVEPVLAAHGLRRARGLGVRWQSHFFAKVLICCALVLFVQGLGLVTACVCVEEEVNVVVA